MGPSELRAADGHAFAAYEARPAAAARGGLVIVQEIFGVNAHVRAVADGFAGEGYHVLAPALFDRAERGVELDYAPADRDRGIALRKAIAIDTMVLDVEAAVRALAGEGKVGVVGYCLGGSIAWLAAARIDGLAAAVGYYGGVIAAALDERPRCPVMLHFGAEDPSIPAADVDRIRAAVDPAMVEVFSYPGAGHAFNRFGSHAHNPASAGLALERTLAFLRTHVG